MKRSETVLSSSRDGVPFKLNFTKLLTLQFIGTDWMSLLLALGSNGRSKTLKGAEDKMKEEMEERYKDT